MRSVAKYDVLREKEIKGEIKSGILRSTFIIDMHGVLKHVLYGVNARNHATEVLHLIKELLEINIEITQIYLRQKNSLLL